MDRLSTGLCFLGSSCGCFLSLHHSPWKVNRSVWSKVTVPSVVLRTRVGTPSGVGVGSRLPYNRADRPSERRGPGPITETCFPYPERRDPN